MLHRKYYYFGCYKHENQWICRKFLNNLEAEFYLNCNPCNSTVRKIIKIHNIFIKKNVILTCLRIRLLSKNRHFPVNLQVMFP